MTNDPCRTPQWREVAERALKALADLSFECDGVVSTSAPSRETYNRTFHEMRALQEFLSVPSETERISLVEHYGLALNAYAIAEKEGRSPSYCMRDALIALEDKINGK